MASPTFTRFLEQLRAQGREKGDGFFPAHFEGLTAAERSEAARLLIAAIQHGDSTAPEGLVLLEGPQARPVLDEALRTLPFQSTARMEAAVQLWQLTGGSSYQAAVAEYLRHPVAITRFVALGHLQDTPPNPDLNKYLIEDIERDGDSANRALAAKLLLYWTGATASVRDAYRTQRALMEALKSDDVTRRREGLRELAASG